MEIRKISRAEVEDLHHVKTEDGWKVVRWQGKSVGDAVKRINFLLKKASKCNSEFEELQAVIKIGVAGLYQGSNSVNWVSTETRLNYRMYDAIREAILVAILFDLYKPNELQVNPLQLMQG